ncbi:MAG TPA: GNAT family N-acetyltransferase [Kofleriaceae bacterium]|nr:GNAT family N-acetyltransferase [Kofleriaceae bacterium]
MRSALVDLPSARRLPDWSRWQQLTAHAPPFLTPEFFTLAARFAEGEPVVAEAWDGDQLVGALPLVHSGDRLVGLRCDYTPEYDYCGAPDGVEAIWRALREDESWSELELAKVPICSPLATRLPALAAADGCPVVARMDSRHPYFALPAFEAGLAPKFRTNLQRCARKAGGVELEKLPVPDRAAFDEALAIEAMAWKAAAGTSIADDPRAAHLYRALARLLGRRGMGALYFLRVGGRRIAALFAVEDGHTVYALKIGYDPSCANLSPGHLIVWKVAADAEARGLVELDFVGRDDEWKRKWTERVHEHVALTIYRNSPAGLARYTVRHLVKPLVRPRLPAALRGGLGEVLPRGCQRADLIGEHTLVQRIRGRLDKGLGIKSGIKRWLRPPPPRPPVGAPSAFAPGSWVRVKDPDALRAVMDAQQKTRGLLFTGAQWKTAGGVFQVSQHVRRLRDDHGRYRPVSRTVLLADVDCSLGDGAEPHGCGRHCPMMYRDEWLEPAAAPSRGPTPAAPADLRHARVRSSEEIKVGLDLRGRRDGLTFMPEMAGHAGKRFPIVEQLTTVFEHDRWTETRGGIYILGGLHCTGAVLGDRGPCDRACALMWHEDWLIVEPTPHADAAG